MVSLGAVEKIKDKLEKKLPGAKGKIETIFTLTKLVALKVKKGELTTKDIEELPLPSSYKSALIKIVKTKDPRIAKQVIHKYEEEISDNLDKIKSVARGNALVNWTIRKIEKKVNKLYKENTAEISIYTAVCIAAAAFDIGVLTLQIIQLASGTESSKASFIYYSVVFLFTTTACLVSAYMARRANY